MRNPQNGQSVIGWTLGQVGPRRANGGSKKAARRSLLRVVKQHHRAALFLHHALVTGNRRGRIFTSRPMRISEGHDQALVRAFLRQRLGIDAHDFLFQFRVQRDVGIIENSSALVSMHRARAMAAALVAGRRTAWRVGRRAYVADANLVQIAAGRRLSTPLPVAVSARYSALPSLLQKSSLAPRG